MATFNGRNWTVADMVPFKYVENWDDFFDDVIAEMEARSEGVGEASEAAIAAAAQAVPAATTATAARDEAVAAANTAAGIVQHVQPSEIAGIDPIVGFPFRASTAVPSGVITGSSGKWVTNQAGLLVNVVSGTAPIDFDPVTSVVHGLLVEQARTNLLTYSQQFDNAAWYPIDCTVTANAAVAPDGTMTADLVAFAAAGGQRFQVATVSAATKYTFSLWVRADNNTQAIRLKWYTNTSGDNITGDYAVSTAWSRISITFTTDSGFVSFNVAVMGRNSGATGAVYCWGAQLEAGSCATSYIPTTSSTVTRAADVNTLLLPGIPGWNAAEYTIYVEAMLPAVSSTANATLIHIDDGTTNNRVEIYRQTDGQLVADSRSGAVTAFTLSGGSVGAGTLIKAAFSVKAGANVLALNGAVLGSSASTVVPGGLTTLRLGAVAGGLNVLNGFLLCVEVFPRGLTSSTLALLTA